MSFNLLIFIFRELSQTRRRYLFQPLQYFEKEYNWIYIERLLMQNEFTNDDMRSIIEKIVIYPDKSVEVCMK